MNPEAALAAAEVHETPLVVVDEPALESNLAAMAVTAAAAGLRLRPHAKTHKSPFVGLRQLAHGAAGLTVATLAEAEVFAAAGVADILVAHPPVGAVKRERLARLAEHPLRLAVSLDDAGVAAGLPPGVDVLWEVDSGGHRLGTAPGAPTLAGVLGLLEVIPRERFRGLITHGGHGYGGDRRGAADDERQALVGSARLLRARGIEVGELSVGSTPTAEFAAAGSGLTEMRPGTYVFGDANQVGLGSHRLERCALAVVATVVSAHPDRVVTDAGSKSLSADLRVAVLEGHGIVLGHPGLVVARLGEEHAVLTGEGLPRVGERLLIVPAHVCTTVNLHPGLLFFGAGEPHWVAVAARARRAGEAGSG